MTEDPQPYDCHEPRVTPDIPGVLLSWKCWSCGRVIGQYTPPISYFSRRCQRCGAMNVLTTEVLTD